MIFKTIKNCMYFNERVIKTSVYSHNYILNFTTLMMDLLYLHTDFIEGPQMIQNCAASVYTSSRKRDHINILHHYRHVVSLTLKYSLYISISISLYLSLSLSILLHFSLPFSLHLSLFLPPPSLSLSLSLSSSSLSICRTILIKYRLSSLLFYT